jgi:hypothetical protein
MNRSAYGLLTVLIALQLAPEPGTVTGVVIKAGTTIRQPLLNARLELTGPGESLVTRTDTNGRFAFSHLPSGAYRLQVTCDGFVRQEAPDKILIGPGQDLKEVLFELDPAPTAAGWVLDTYGRPMANVMVEALRRAYDVRGKPIMVGAATALTDDRGAYRIFWLDPGEYYFYATSPPVPDGSEAPLLAVVPTYFPGVNTPEDAKAVQLDIGREVPVDFRLRSAGFWVVRGQTMNAATGRSVAAAISLFPPAEDPTLTRYSAQSSATGPYHGEFTIDNVVPGTYILMARSGPEGQQMTAIQRIVLRPELSPPIDLRGYSLRLSPALSIHGQLFLGSASTPDLRGVNVSLVSTEPALPSPRSVKVQPDGSFTLNGVSPGSYLLELSNLPEDFYLKAARFGQDDILEKPLTLDQDAASPLQMLLASDGGHLQVSAHDDKGATRTDAQFVLVPDKARRDRREQYRAAAAGDDGKAILRGIPPGAYTLFAWQVLEPNAYFNSDYLSGYAAFGVPVAIAAGDNPPLSVRLIPKD